MHIYREFPQRVQLIRVHRQGLLVMENRLLRISEEVLVDRCKDFMCSRKIGIQSQRLLCIFFGSRNIILLLDAYIDILPIDQCQS